MPRSLKLTTICTTLAGLTTTTPCAMAERAPEDKAEIVITGKVDESSSIRSTKATTSSPAMPCTVNLLRDPGAPFANDSAEQLLIIAAGDGEQGDEYQRGGLGRRRPRTVPDSRSDERCGPERRHYHQERLHQGKDNLPLTGDWSAPSSEGAIQSRCACVGCSSTTTGRGREVGGGGTPHSPSISSANGARRWGYLSDHQLFDLHSSLER